MRGNPENSGMAPDVNFVQVNTENENHRLQGQETQE